MFKLVAEGIWAGKTKERQGNIIVTTNWFHKRLEEPLIELHQLNTSNSTL